jgi:DNA-binding Lrp family transcriptional regulator
MTRPCGFDVDATDIRILRTMGIQPFLTWPHPPERLKATKIAKDLGLQPETVKERIARLEKDGTITGYEIYPNFRHLGLIPSTYHFRVADTSKKTRAIKDVGRAEGVVGVYNFVGPEVCVDLAHRGPSDLVRKIKIVETLLGAERAPYACFDFHLPRVERKLTALDWKIVRALRGNALKTHGEVGAELRISARTVRRRFDRMVKEGSFDIVPIIDLGQITGFILYELAITFDAAQTERLKNPVLQLVADALCSAWPMPDEERHGMTLLLLARTVSEIEMFRKRAEALPGVKQVDALLPSDSTTNDAWIDEAIAERIREPDLEPETLLTRSP